MEENRKPTIGRLILQKVKDEQVTKGGIVMVDSFETPLQRCKILAYGECKNTFWIGHYAYIPRHNGIDLGGDEVSVREEEIMFTVNE